MVGSSRRCWRGYRSRASRFPNYTDPGSFPWALTALGHSLTRWSGCPQPQQTLCPRRDGERTSSVSSSTQAGFCESSLLSFADLTIGWGAGWLSMAPAHTSSLSMAISRASCKVCGWASWVCVHSSAGERAWRNWSRAISLCTAGGMWAYARRDRHSISRARSVSPGFLRLLHSSERISPGTTHSSKCLLSAPH